jgi:hypothetical protein
MLRKAGLMESALGTFGIGGSTEFLSQVTVGGRSLDQINWNNVAWQGSMFGVGSIMVHLNRTCCSVIIFFRVLRVLLLLLLGLGHGTIL